MDDFQAETRRLVEKMLQETGLTPTELARAAGLTPSTLTRFMNKDVKHSLSAKTLSKLSAYSNVSVPKAVSDWAIKTLVPVVGYIGAGEQMYPYDDGAMGEGLDRVESPPGADDDTVAVVVRGESMFPAFWDGDVLYYTRDAGFERAECLYNECIVKVMDGPIYIKRVMPGSSPDTYILHSYNAAPIFDVTIEWAAPVQFQDKRRRRAKA